MNISRGFLVYVLIAVVVVAAVAIAASMLINNGYSVAVKVVPLNSKGNVTYSGLYPYNTTFFSILVNNTGNGKITGLPLVVYLNGRTYDTYNLTIPKGEGIAVHMNYTYTSPGNFTFDAVADPAGLFKIANRTEASNTVSILIDTPAAPFPYMNLPSNGIVSGEDTVLKNYGIGMAYLFGNVYNSSGFSEMTGPKMSSDLLNTLGPYTNQAFAAYAQYKNGSWAYSSWMQGSQSPYLISKLFGSKGIKSNVVSLSGDTLYNGVIDNSIAFCMDYNGGWTRISYYGSNSIGCDVFLNQNNSASKKLIGATINSSNTLLGYSERFLYSNSIGDGSGFMFSPNSVSITNLFHNGFGAFAAVAQSNKSISANYTPVCAGSLAVSPQNGSVCSSSIVGLANLTGYALTNSTEFFKGYRFSLYSVVNENSISTEYSNAAGLMGSLGFNGTAIDFHSYFNNTCNTSNSLITCKIKSFNPANEIANLDFYNKLNGSISVNSVSCYIGLPVIESINLTIPSNSERSVVLDCTVPPSQSFSLLTNYNLIMNYTYEGRNESLKGIVGITNFK